MDLSNPNIDAGSRNCWRAAYSEPAVAAKNAEIASARTCSRAVGTPAVSAASRSMLIANSPSPKRPARIHIVVSITRTKTTTVA